MFSGHDERRDGHIVIESAEVFSPVFDQPSSYEALEKVAASPGFKLLVARMDDRLKVG
jgi:hypothetical protein